SSEAARTRGGRLSERRGAPGEPAGVRLTARPRSPRQMAPHGTHMKDVQVLRGGQRSVDPSRTLSSRWQTATAERAHQASGRPSIDASEGTSPEPDRPRERDRANAPADTL